MNNIKYYILVLTVATMMLPSCNDEFMQQDPLTTLAEGAVLDKEGFLPIYLNQLYPLYITGHQSGNAYTAVAPLAMQGSEIVFPDLCTDNAVAFTGTAGSPSTRLDGTFRTPESGTSTGWDWTQLRRVNYFLRHYHEAEGSVTDPAQLNKWAAEAYFFKAWDYYKKLYIFGEVPWLVYDLNTDSEELTNSTATPRAALTDSILSCLNYAVQYLNDNNNPNGRVNRDMANFLKARFCLFEATFRKYHKNDKAPMPAVPAEYNSLLDECIKACEAIIASGHYSLYYNAADKDAFGNNNSYWKMFSFNQTPAEDGNTEAILARVYDGSKLGHGMPRYYSMNRGNASGRYSKGLTKEFVDEYLCIDGKPITGNSNFLGYDGMWSELENRDPRLTQTIAMPGDYMTIWTRDGEKINGVDIPKGTMDAKLLGIRYPEITYNCPTANQVKHGGPSITGYEIVKHWTPDPDDNGTTTNSKQTAVMFRYGEVLITLAEALYERNGSISDADLDRTINLLRTRAGFPASAKLTNATVPADPALDAIYSEKLDYTVSPMLREIRRERRVELAQEGRRREDLVRWKAGKLMEVPLRGMKFTAEKQELYNGSNTQPPIIAMGAYLNVDVFTDSDGFIIAFPKATSVTNGTLKWEDRYYYWPIPLRELTLNTNLKQNPGWEDIPR